MTAETINTSTDALILDGVALKLLRIATCPYLSAYMHMGRKEALGDQWQIACQLLPDKSLINGNASSVYQILKQSLNELPT